MCDGGWVKSWIPFKMVKSDLCLVIQAVWVGGQAMSFTVNQGTAGPHLYRDRGRNRNTFCTGTGVGTGQHLYRDRGRNRTALVQGQG